MFLQLPALLCAFTLLHPCLATIIRCLPSDYPLNPIIDNIWEDCGFEGPLPYIGDGPSPIQTMTFNFWDERSANASNLWLNFLISDRAIPAKGGMFNRNHVKEVTLRGLNWQGLLPLVEHVFERLGGLEVVRWEMHQPISDAILRSFEQISPNPRIFYDLQSWGGGPAWSLTNSSLLYSLKADIEWADEANYEAVDFVFAALANATGLRELDLYLHHEGCVVGRDTPQAFPFAGYPDVRFQPLEVLRLDGYKLDESEDGGWEWKQRGRAPWKAPSWSDWFREKWFEWSRKKWFGEVGENEATESNNRRTNLEAWLEVMDWSHLHTLHLAWPSKATLNHLQGQTLPALTNLSLAISDYFGDAKAQDIIPFLTNTAQPLRGVIIKSSQTELGDPILETFIAAPNLTQELRQFSYRHGPELEDKSFLSQDLISKFLHSTPSLESLDIELPRDVNTSTDTGLFSNLINSPSLKKTTLRFPSPDLDYQTMRWDDSGSQLSMQYHEMRRNYYTSNGTDDEADPLFNEDTALAMFKKMRARKRGAELKELELYVGDWEDRDFRGMMGRVMVRVAYWGCFVVDGAERCEGGQMRLLE